MEEVIKVLAALGAIFGLYKITVDVIIARANKHREEYQFAKDYIHDLNDSSVHKFILEKGFRALTGSMYSVEEAKHLLSYNEPTKAIILRASAKETIAFNHSELKYDWMGVYSKKIFRNLAAWGYLVLYFIFAYIVLYPLFGSDNSSSISHIPIAIFAIYFAIKHSDFRDTIKFMQLEKMKPLESD